MWTIVRSLFLSALLASEIHGQTTGLLYKPQEYLAAVVDEFWAKIKDHGISNLPVFDTSVLYNFTSFGVELIGTVSLEDGFVQDIDSISLSSQNFVWSATPALARVTGRIFFNNLRLYRDLRADLATGTKLGTTVVTPTECIYQLVIEKLHDNETIVPTLSYLGDSNPVWDIHPDDLETRLIRRQFANQSNQASGNRPQLISTTTTSWIPLFTQFLNGIVTTIEFPDMSF